MAKFSVVIPCKNSGTTINRAVDSVVAQLEPGITCEVILVPAQPGSLDSTFDSVQDKRFVRVAQAGRPLPLNESRNFGLDLAEGDFVSFLDADDYLHPGVFSRVLTLFKSNLDLDLVVGEIDIQRGLEISLFSDSYAGLGFLDTADKKDSFMGTRGGLWWQVGSFFFRRSKLLFTGLKFDTTVGFGEDGLFLASAICAFSVYAVPTPFVVYVANDNGAHKSSSNRTSWIAPTGDPFFLKELGVYQKYGMEKSTKRMKDAILKTFLCQCALFKKDSRDTLAHYFHHIHLLSRLGHSSYPQLLFLYRLFGYRFCWWLYRVYKTIRKKKSLSH